MVMVGVKRAVNWCQFTCDAVPFTLSLPPSALRVERVAPRPFHIAIPSACALRRVAVTRKIRGCATAQLKVRGTFVAEVAVQFTWSRYHVNTLTRLHVPTSLPLSALKSSPSHL